MYDVNRDAVDRPLRLHARSTEGGDDTKLLAAAVAAAKRGDQEGIRFLYVRYSADVYGFVRSMLRDEHEAEDVTQHVFTKLIDGIRKYEPREVPFKAWILRVARNAALDRMRARRAIPVEEVRGADVACEASNRELLESLTCALADIPEDQREVLAMRHIVGLSPGEIADRLGKTEGAIHGLHHRGRRSLQAALRKLDATPTTA